MSGPIYVGYQTRFQNSKGKSHLLEGHVGQNYNSFAFVSWIIEETEAAKAEVVRQAKTERANAKLILELQKRISDGVVIETNSLEDNGITDQLNGYDIFKLAPGKRFSIVELKGGE